MGVIGKHYKQQGRKAMGGVETLGVIIVGSALGILSILVVLKALWLALGCLLNDNNMD